jgi:hypothetical protein
MLRPCSVNSQFKQVTVRINAVATQGTIIVITSARGDQVNDEPSAMIAFRHGPFTERNGHQERPRNAEQLILSHEQFIVSHERRSISNEWLIQCFT